MAYLYILYSPYLNHYYIGSTPDVERRLAEHNRGKTASTKTGMPWSLVFTHQTASIVEARQLEYKLKSWKDRRIIQRIIKEQRLKASA